MCRHGLFFAGAALLSLVSLGAQEAASKFEVASIKRNTSEEPQTSNFPLGPGDVYTRNGGRFSAKNVPLTTYIAFAYKIIGNQGQYLTPQLPDWAQADHYDIEAKAAGDPGKDDMRLMMRALLAERFKFAVSYEEREVPVLAFVLAKPGKFGPNLRAHPDGTPCPTEQPGWSGELVDGLPLYCNGIFNLPPQPGRYHFGARNVTLGFIADTFSAGVDLGRPLVDGTGLSGKFDFSLEWAKPARQPPAGGAELAADPGLSFEDALREQLGIKLEKQKVPMKVMVLSHIERPSEN